MKKFSTTYMFNNVRDMIDLAKRIQTKVYWSYVFRIDEDMLNYNELWDIIDDKVSEGSAKGIRIYDNDEITFITEEE